MKLFQSVKRLLTVPNDNPELALAQFKAFSKQVPLLYFILLTNMLSLAGTHQQSAPFWLVKVVPAVFAVIFIVRGIGWIRESRKTVDAAYAYRRLISTNLLVPPIAIMSVAWSVALIPYGNDYQRAHVAFFMSITVIGVIFCLMHLRSAALMVTFLVILPFAIVMGLSGEPTLIATAVNMFLVSLAMIAILMRHYSDFTKLNEQRLTLLAQQAALHDKNREMQLLSDENLRLANLDSLTQIANRRSFFSNLTSAFERARAENRRLAIGVVDLDGFKPVNDLYGHSAGDKVLIEVADRLSTFGRAGCSIFRLGGDEFALLIDMDGKAAMDEKALVELGQRICASLSLPIMIGNSVVHVTGSMGIAVYPDVGLNGQDLYERADYALYSAKRENRASVVVFNARQAKALFRQRQVEEVLFAADLSREITLAYQPIVDARSGRTVGFEALARWTSPVLGPVSPAEFIPIAEQHGRINLITRLLLTRALKDAASWRGEPYLSFNLSPHDLAVEENVLRIISAVSSSDIAPERINFEITETAIMHDFEQAAHSIELLRALGCQMSLDDFGTGYSSLNHVHKLPLSKIKIDRSFVDRIDERPASYKIVKSVLTLCSEMGLTAIAEGVEREEEVRVLKQLGVNAMQGYYFSTPLVQDLAAARLEREQADAGAAMALVTGE
ncbi:putative bifunctional diguanylate cyclase/phosphodiesterase [Rhizobium sp. C4]|uniref:putative bifunctional diguanylate cyclase/phosphodiesterase n=1 Tax=Rhizobium sp. C4 TaxID=1349800 RepID=UPI001E5CFA36|nr:EAL domain-containing protein [Rhizobium sp. C4]MCD2175633.1 EAL domain-containing protein [Rhizobium sp. C4]